LVILSALLQKKQQYRQNREISISLAHGLKPPMVIVVEAPQASLVPFKKHTTFLLLGIYDHIMVDGPGKKSYFFNKICDQ